MTKESICHIWEVLIFYHFSSSCQLNCLLTCLCKISLPDNLPLIWWLPNAAHWGIKMRYCSQWTACSVLRLPVKQLMIFDTYTVVIVRSSRRRTENQEASRPTAVVSRSLQAPRPHGLVPVCWHLYPHANCFSHRQYICCTYIYRWWASAKGKSQTQRAEHVTPTVASSSWPSSRAGLKWQQL